MAYRVTEVWLLLLVFLLAAAAASSASITPNPRSAEEEVNKKAVAAPPARKKVDDANNTSSSSAAAAPTAGKDAQKETKEKEKPAGCVTTKECHMKRLVCAKKCTLAAHKRCAAKCSRACTSLPICATLLHHLPFP